MQIKMQLVEVKWYILQFYIICVVPNTSADFLCSSCIFCKVNNIKIENTCFKTVQTSVFKSRLYQHTINLLVILKIAL